jgi:hypothetical protein
MKFLFQQLARKKNDRGQKIVYNFEHETISYVEEGEIGVEDDERWSETKRNKDNRVKHSPVSNWSMLNKHKLMKSFMLS